MIFIVALHTVAWVAFDFWVCFNTSMMRAPGGLEKKKKRKSITFLNNNNNRQGHCVVACLLPVFLAFLPYWHFLGMVCLRLV